MPVAAFRVDVSEFIGAGHFMRCMTLAEGLKKLEWSCVFISVELHQVYERLIHGRGIEYISLSKNDELLDWQIDAKETAHCLRDQNCDLLIVDHYALDANWHRHMRPFVKQLMVIDDLANRPYDCDILLDQTIGRSDEDYSKYVPDKCKLLLGSSMALIRPEFLQYRPDMEAHGVRRASLKKPYKNVLVNYGGSDVLSLSLTTLKTLSSLPFVEELVITLLINRLGKEALLINKEFLSLPFKVNLLSDIDNMADLLSRQDIVIGAAGTSCWERSCLALPSILVQLADNQAENIARLEKKNAIVNLGKDKPLNQQLLIETLNEWHEQPELVEAISRSAYQITDGRGLYRILLSLVSSKDNPGLKLRMANEDDCGIIYSWQCMPGVRAYSRNSDIPSWEEHQQWYGRMMQNPQSKLWLVSFMGQLLGFVRLDDSDEDDVLEISIVTSPDYSRLGVGVWMLTEIQKIEKNKCLKGVVNSRNHASIKLFKSAGYIEKQSGQFYNR